MFLTLTDEDGEETHISDALIGAGIALFDEMECPTDSGISSAGNVRSQMEDEIDLPENGAYVFTIDCTISTFLTICLFSDGGQGNETASSASTAETDVSAISIFLGGG